MVKDLPTYVRIGEEGYSQFTKNLIDRKHYKETNMQVLSWEIINDILKNNYGIELRKEINHTKAFDPSETKETGWIWLVGKM